MIGKFLSGTLWQCEINSILQDSGIMSMDVHSGDSFMKFALLKWNLLTGHLKAFDTCKDPMHPWMTKSMEIKYCLIKGLI